jgi:hypothetical protein
MEWELPSRQHQPHHYTCFRCADLSDQFTQEALASFPADLSPEEQIRRLTQLTREVDDRVRAVVRGTQS